MALRAVFKDKKELLTLFNAVNGTDYDNPEELQITTLDNAIYLSMKNDIYTPKLIKLPNPKFVIFYNGKDEQPAIKDMRLSDAFYREEENPSLELVVTQININPGYNDDLLDKCKSLKDYTVYVSLVREYLKEAPLKDAIEKAVDDCIRDDILADFLSKNKA